MILWYSVPDALRSRDPQFQDGSLDDIGSVLQEQFTSSRLFFHYGTAARLVLLPAGGGVRTSALLHSLLQPPFVGGPTVRKLRCPVRALVRIRTPCFQPW